MRKNNNSKKLTAPAKTIIKKSAETKKRGRRRGPDQEHNELSEKIKECVRQSMEQFGAQYQASLQAVQLQARALEQMQMVDSRFHFLQQSYQQQQQSFLTSLRDETRLLRECVAAITKPRGTNSLEGFTNEQQLFPSIGEFGVEL